MLSVIVWLYLCSWISYGDATCSSNIIQTFTSDVVLSASSEYASKNKTYDYGVSRGVLNYTEFTDKNGVVYMGAWTAEINDDKQYIQIQLSKDFLIKGIITQGKNGCCQEWVTEYRVFYGDDCKNLRVLDSGNGTRFKGNTDENTMVTHLFTFPVNAKCVRISPEHWHNKISMRADLIGCTNQTVIPSTSTRSTSVPMTTQTSVTQSVFLPGVCSTNLLTSNTSLSSSITASSIKDKSSFLVSYSPDKAILYSREQTNMSSSRFMGGWSPQTSDLNQYIQVEFSDPAVIKGIVTQGKNGCCKKWVKKYKVTYSTDCKTWNISGGGAGQVFIANNDEDTPVTNILICPTAVKCIRLEPLEWNNKVGLRFELIGCPTKNGFSNQVSSSGTNSASTVAMQTTIKTTTVHMSSSPPLTTVPSTTSTQSAGAQCTSYLFSKQPYQQNIKMTASSELKEFDKTNDHSADRGRLHSTETMAIGVILHGAWSAAFKDTNQYIKIQLPNIATITGIVTQGKDGNDKEWVSKYRVLYSADCKQWSVVMGPTGSAFNGNTDSATEVANMFSRPVKAMCIKINPEAWNHQISLRMDLIGCFGSSTQQSTSQSQQQTTTIPSTTTTTQRQTTTMQTQATTTPTSGTTSQSQLCQESLINNSTLGSLVNLTATSQFHNPTTGTDPSRALLDTKTKNIQLYTLLGGWAPAADGHNQYIQATFDSALLIHSVITQGLDGKQQWVTKYTIQYSDDCVYWQKLQNSKEFVANTDDKSKVTNKFACPVFAKCVRLYPTEWNTHSGLRLDIIGCEIIGGVYHNISYTTATATVTTVAASTGPVITTRSYVAQTPTTSPMNTSISTKSSTTTGTTLSSASPSTQTPTTLSSTSSSTKAATTLSTTFSSTNPSTNASTALPSTNSTTSTTHSVTQSTTKPATHITHKIFPTGVAPNYDKRDPLDCKRALLVDPCNLPIVKKHCFYSCNRNPGISISPSPIHTTVYIQSASMFVSKSMPTTFSIQSSTASTHVGLSTDQVSTNKIQSSLKQMSSSAMFQSQSLPSSINHSSLKTDSISLGSSMSTAILQHTMTVSAQKSLTLASSITPQLNSGSQVLSTTQLVSPTSSLAPTASITVTPPVTHITHVTLPTGQATIYNPLDPPDCKRSLLLFSCSLSIVAKHCSHSCSKNSTSVVSSSLALFPSSSNSLSSTTVKTTTSSLSGSSLLLHSKSSMKSNPLSSILTSDVSNSNISPSSSPLPSSSSLNVQNLHQSDLLSSITKLSLSSLKETSGVTFSSFDTTRSKASSISSKISVSLSSSVMSGSVTTGMYINTSPIDLPSSTMSSVTLASSQSSSKHTISPTSVIATSTVAGNRNSISSYPITPMSESSLAYSFQSNTDAKSSAILSEMSTDCMTIMSSAVQTLATDQSSIFLTSAESSDIFSTHFIHHMSSKIHTSAFGSSGINSRISTTTRLTGLGSSSVLSSNIDSVIQPMSTDTNQMSSNLPGTNTASLNMQSVAQAGYSAHTSALPSVSDHSSMTTGMYSTQMSLSSSQLSLHPTSETSSLKSGSTATPLLSSPANILSSSIISLSMASSSINYGVMTSALVPMVSGSSQVFSSFTSTVETSSVMSLAIAAKQATMLGISSQLASHASSQLPFTPTPSADLSSLSSLDFLSSDIIRLSDSSVISSATNFPSSEASMVSGITMLSSNAMSTNPSMFSSSNLLSTSDMSINPSAVFMSSDLPSTFLLSASAMSINPSAVLVSSSILQPSTNIFASSVLPFTGMVPSSDLPIGSSDTFMSSDLSSLLPNMFMSSVPHSTDLLSSGRISSSHSAADMSSYAFVLSTDSLLSSMTSSSNPLLSHFSQTPHAIASSSHPLNSPITSVSLLSSSLGMSVSTDNIPSTMQVTSNYVFSSQVSTSLFVSSLSSSSQNSVSGSVLPVPSSTYVSSDALISSLVASPSSGIAPTSSIITTSSAMSSMSNNISVSLTCVPVSMSSDTTIGVFPSTVPPNLMSQNSDMSFLATPMQYSSMPLSSAGLSSTSISSSVTVMPSKASLTCYYVPITMTSVSALPFVQSALLPSQLTTSPLYSNNSPISTAISTSSVTIATASTQVSGYITTTAQSSSASTFTTNIPKQTTTVTHITHVTIPTGVASLYDNRDPVDCKRTLIIAPCSIPVVAKHCPYSCGTHPRKRRALSTNNSNLSNSYKKLARLSWRFRPSHTNLTWILNHHNLNTIDNTTDNRKIMDIKTKKRTSVLNLAAVKMIKAKMVPPDTQSWYDPKDPTECQSLMKKINCTDLFYGSKCRWSCLKKRQVE